jgi:hypothetical protein
MGFGKRLFEQFAWQNFRPHPEWASFHATDDINGPQSAGIPGVVRLIYAPRAESLEVREMGLRAAFTARWFDPVTGITTPLGEIRSDGEGRWTCPPPAGLDHDWVLILESKA